MYSNFISLIASDEPNYQNLLPYFEDVSNWKQFGAFLLPKKYGSRINDIDDSYKGNVTECRWALIREYLKVGEISWKQVLNALEKSNHTNVAEKIKKDIFNI